MENKNLTDNIYEAKPNQNLRQVLESAIVQARVSKTKKVLVILKRQHGEKRFEINADDTITDAISAWINAKTIVQQQQKSPYTR